MHADLVGATGAGLEFHIGETTESLSHLVETDRFSGFGNIAVGGDHADPVGGVVHDPFFDVVAVAVEHTLGNGGIFLEYFAGLKHHR